MQRHKAHIAATNPKLSSDEVEVALQKELPHTRIAAGVPRTAHPPQGDTVTSGGLGKVEAALRLAAAETFIDIGVLKQHIGAQLRKELDYDRDGRISRTDFLMRWKPTVTRMQTIDKETKGLCNIL